jgi:hypothetical protein
VAAISPTRRRAVIRWPRPRGYPLAQKVTAVLLYLSGLSMRRTAKLLGVSPPTVQEWIERLAAAYATKPEPTGRAVVIELDEMWHFIKKTLAGLQPSCGQRNGPTVGSDGGGERPVSFWWRMIP